MVLLNVLCQYTDMSDLQATADIVIHGAFAEAWDFLEHSNENIFITGKAGTGKSTFLNYVRKNSAKNVAIVAPTGVSALNVKGQTIHSFFGLDPHFIDVDKIGRRRNKQIYKNLELLIIDEISMVRADVFSGLEKVLRVNGPVEGAPFGGVQICVIGDLFQLPPVVTRDESEIFHAFYETPFFFSSMAFDWAQFKLVKFDKVFRQSEQPFVQALNKLRVGYADDGLLSYLNTRYGVDDTQAPSDIVTLCTTNKMAEFMNEKALSALETESRLYKGKLERAEKWSGRTFPSPESLVLKLDALVMFTKNDPDKRWVNGSVGKVEALREKEVDVILMEGLLPKKVTVSAEKWSAIRYVFDEETESLKEEEIGSYTQLPLMLSWAVTIHKAQGKTLDWVKIDLGTGTFAPGQLYVAMSRCRTFEHIFLKKPVRRRDIQSDLRIQNFIKSFQNKAREEGASS